MQDAHQGIHRASSSGWGGATADGRGYATAVSPIALGWFVRPILYVCPFGRLILLGQEGPQA
jgi:hypothetical protein